MARKGHFFIQNLVWHWFKISAMQPEDLQRLISTAMPYGKHKGKMIADLPGNYLNWFAREGFPTGEIGRLLQLMQEIDHNGLSSLLEPLRK
jgi:uncharacterized protein